jgi:hypothetical protein
MCIFLHGGVAYAISPASPSVASARKRGEFIMEFAVKFVHIIAHTASFSRHGVSF